MMTLRSKLRFTRSAKSDVSGHPLAVFIRVPSWLGRTERHPENCEAPIDLGIAAALVEQDGWWADILDLETGSYTLESVRTWFTLHQPELVVLSGITPAAENMLLLAKTAKAIKQDCCIIACGQHADALPESLLFEQSPIDLCAKGEFEETIRDLARALCTDATITVAGTRSFRQGKVVTHGRRPLIQDLDALPFPLHRFFLNRHYRYLHPMTLVGRYRWGFIQGSRGCPYHCLYCSKALRTSFGHSMRSRSAASIVAEIRHLQSQGVNVLVFTDDFFNHSKERVLELCEEIRRNDIRIHWTAQGRVRPTDPELFQAMKVSGCSTFSMGVESGSPRILQTLKKKAEAEEAVAAFRYAREAGLLTVGFFMVGSPGETEDDFLQTKQLLHRLDPDILQVAFFTCYPGAEAYRLYRERLPEDWRAFQHYETLSNLSAVSDERVRQWQRSLYRDFLLRPSYVLRYLRLKHINLLLNLDTEGFLALQAARFLFSRKS